ncbi:HAD family hydrolase [uncultured Methanobrevibacter sp.]|uniref:HAD family hydrolase n=1 Tax=uncultured Methanobrevibacter sp. TaxID=253161 RepID=UPI0025CEECCB|nr:HAD family hydrolase [uncultured Methanobrevibacter sp.]
MNNKAIVFDNSGTILKRYKIIKNVKTGEFIDNINSLTIIDNLDSGALAILQFNTKCLFKLNSNTTIYDLISKYNIEFTVSYSTYNMDYNNIFNIIKEDPSTISDITDGINLLRENVPNMDICNGTALILDCKNHEILYTITSAGVLFDNLKFTINKLKEIGYDIFIASGDRTATIQYLCNILNIDSSHGFPTASPEDKRDIVKSLQEKYDCVVMVGDGQNDYYALSEANIGVLTIAQSPIESDKLISATNFIISDLLELLNILD